MTISDPQPGINALRRPVDRDRASTPGVLRARADQTPEAPFLIWGDRIWTYGEAFEEMGRWAGLFRSLGAGPDGPRVAGYLENRPEGVWAWLGAQLAGAVYVCLNREHRGALLHDHLARSGAGVVVTERRALSELPTGRGGHVLVVDDDTGALTGPSADAAPWKGVDPDPGSVATVMFTSGTTGRSKAVLIPHNQLCRGAAHLAARMGMGANDVFHGWMPLFHIAGQLHLFMTSAIAGGAVALFPGFSASRFWEQVVASGATIISGLPATARILWEMEPGELEGRGRETLRLGVFGPMTPELHRPLEERLGIRIVDTYGMTEAEPLTVPLPDRPAPVGSCGVPGPDFELRITDPDGRSVPPGQPGEIRIRPRVPHVMFAGYENDPRATEEAFADGWFRTGDLARQDRDGFVYYVDRKANFIRHRGENVSAWELQRLLEDHPSVAQAFVHPVPSPLGEDDIRAVVVAAGTPMLEAAELHAWCRDRMARFMVPRYIQIRDSLPYKSVGKVDRAALEDDTDGTWDAEA